MDTKNLYNEVLDIRKYILKPDYMDFFLKLSLGLSG